MSSRFKFYTRLRPFALILSLVGGMFAAAPLASASVIPSRAIVAETGREADLVTIRQSLENKQVKHRLGELGFTDAEIQQRLAHASDAELHQLATQANAVMPGGDAGIIVTVLVIVILVLLIQRLT